MSQPKNTLKSGYLSGSTMALGDLSGEGQSLQWLAMLQDAAHAARSCQSLYDANYRDKLDEKKSLAKFFCLGKKPNKNKALEYSNRSRESLFELPVDEAKKSQTLKSIKEGTLKKRNRFNFPFRSLQSKTDKFLPKFQFEKVVDQGILAPKGQTLSEKRVLGEDIIEEVFGKSEIDQNSNIIESSVKLKKTDKKTKTSGSHRKVDRTEKNKAGLRKSKDNSEFTPTSFKLEDQDDHIDGYIYRPMKIRDKSQQQRKLEPINITKKVKSIDFTRPSTSEVTTDEIVDDKENLEPRVPISEIENNFINDNIVELEKHGEPTVKKRLSARDENGQAYINRDDRLSKTKDTFKVKNDHKNKTQNIDNSKIKTTMKKQTSTPILSLDSSPTRQGSKISSSFKKELEKLTLYQQRSSQRSSDSSFIEWNTNAVYESESVAELIKEETLTFLKGRPLKNNIKQCCLTLEWVETRTETVKDTTYVYKKAEIRLDYDLVRTPELIEETVKIFRENNGKETMQVLKKIDGKEVIEEINDKHNSILEHLYSINDLEVKTNNDKSRNTGESFENSRMIMEKLRLICKSPNMTSSSSQSSLLNTSSLDTAIETYSQDSSGIFYLKANTREINQLEKFSNDSSAATLIKDTPPIIPPRKDRLSHTFEPLKDKKVTDAKFSCASPTTPKAIDNDNSLKINDNDFLDRQSNNFLPDSTYDKQIDTLTYISAISDLTDKMKDTESVGVLKDTNVKSSLPVSTSLNQNTSSIDEAKDENEIPTNKIDFMTSKINEDIISSKIISDLDNKLIFEPNKANLIPERELTSTACPCAIQPNIFEPHYDLQYILNENKYISQPVLDDLTKAKHTEINRKEDISDIEFGRRPIIINDSSQIITTPQLVEKTNDNLENSKLDNFLRRHDTESSESFQSNFHTETTFSNNILTADKSDNAEYISSEDESDFQSPLSQSIAVMKTKINEHDVNEESLNRLSDSETGEDEYASPLSASILNVDSDPQSDFIGHHNNTDQLNKIPTITLEPDNLDMSLVVSSPDSSQYFDAIQISLCAGAAMSTEKDGKPAPNDKFNNSTAHDIQRVETSVRTKDTDTQSLFSLFSCNTEVCSNLDQSDIKQSFIGTADPTHSHAPVFHLPLLSTQRSELEDIAINPIQCKLCRNHDEIHTIHIPESGSSIVFDKKKSICNQINYNGIDGETIQTNDVDASGHLIDNDIVKDHIISNYKFRDQPFSINNDEMGTTTYLNWGDVKEPLDGKTSTADDKDIDRYITDIEEKYPSRYGDPEFDALHSKYRPSFFDSRYKLNKTANFGNKIIQIDTNIPDIYDSDHRISEDLNTFKNNLNNFSDSQFNIDLETSNNISISTDTENPLNSKCFVTIQDLKSATDINKELCNMNFDITKEIYMSKHKKNPLDDIQVNNKSILNRDIKPEIKNNNESELATIHEGSLTSFNKKSLEKFDYLKDINEVNILNEDTKFTICIDKKLDNIILDVTKDINLRNAKENLISKNLNQTFEDNLNGDKYFDAALPLLPNLPQIMALEYEESEFNDEWEVEKALDKALDCDRSSDSLHLEIKKSVNEDDTVSCCSEKSQDWCDYDAREKFEDFIVAVQKTGEKKISDPKIIKKTKKKKVPTATLR